MDVGDPVWHEEERTRIRVHTFEVAFAATAHR